MEKVVNYQKVFKSTEESLKSEGRKPKLLLHVCCGPCLTIPYEELKDYFDVTIIFNNSNIYPKQEHDRRLEELKKYVSSVCPKVKIIEIPYDNITYTKDLLPYANEPEGHNRCRVCFRKRLTFGFKYAREHGFDYFTTVMTLSRYKNAQDINRLGAELEEKYSSVKWLFADFKKNNGYERSLLLIKAHNMYFQHYCGCIFSYQNYLKKNAGK